MQSICVCSDYLLVPFILLLSFKFLEIRSFVVSLYALQRLSAPEYWLNIVTLNSYSWEHPYSVLSRWNKLGLGLDRKKGHYPEIRALYSRKVMYLPKVTVIIGRMSAGI